MPTIVFTDKNLHPHISADKYESYYEGVLVENGLDIKRSKWTYNPRKNSLVCIYGVWGFPRTGKISSSLKRSRGKFLVNTDEQGKIEEIVSHIPTSLRVLGLWEREIKLLG